MSKVPDSVFTRISGIQRDLETFLRKAASSSAA